MHIIEVDRLRQGKPENSRNNKFWQYFAFICRRTVSSYKQEKNIVVFYFSVWFEKPWLAPLSIMSIFNIKRQKRLCQFFVFRSISVAYLLYRFFWFRFTSAQSILFCHLLFFFGYPRVWRRFSRGFYRCRAVLRRYFMFSVRTERFPICQYFWKTILRQNVVSFVIRFPTAGRKTARSWHNIEYYIRSKPPSAWFFVAVSDLFPGPVMNALG